LKVAQHEPIVTNQGGGVRTRLNILT
jgi:hypothetical protein